MDNQTGPSAAMRTSLDAQHAAVSRAARDAEEPRVSFGPGPSDTMPLVWAEECLTWLYANRKTVFGDMMLARLGIEKKTPGRKPAES